MTRSDVYQSGYVVVIVHFNRFGGPSSFDLKQRCRLDLTAHVTLFCARGPLKRRSVRSAVKAKGRLLSTAAPSSSAMAARRHYVAGLGLYASPLVSKVGAATYLYTTNTCRRLFYARDVVVCRGQRLQGRRVDGREASRISQA